MSRPVSDRVQSRAEGCAGQRICNIHVAIWTLASTKLVGTFLGNELQCKHRPQMREIYTAELVVKM
jgi:hypothetical protein